MQVLSKDINEYNLSQNEINQEICSELAKIINANLNFDNSKLWHGGPVWFIDENPIVGYWVRKNNVSLLFWSGQSFEEEGLKKEGKFMAADAKYTNIDQINHKDIKRWLKKSENIQWDYKNIVKRKGKLERLK